MREELTLHKPVTARDAYTFRFTEQVKESSDWLADTIYEFVCQKLLHHRIDHRYLMLPAWAVLRYHQHRIHELTQHEEFKRHTKSDDSNFVYCDSDTEIYFSPYRELSLLHYMINELVKNAIDDFAQKRLSHAERLTLHTVIKSMPNGEVVLKIKDNSSQYPGHGKGRYFNLGGKPWEPSDKHMSTHLGGQGMGLLGCTVMLGSTNFFFKNRKKVGFSAYLHLKDGSTEETPVETAPRSEETTCCYSLRPRQ